MTTRKRHTPEQVARKLGQPDWLLGEGEDVADVCRPRPSRRTTGGGTSLVGSRATTRDG